MQLQFSGNNQEKVNAVYKELEAEYGMDGIVFALFNAITTPDVPSGGSTISSTEGMATKMAELKTKYGL